MTTRILEIPLTPQPQKFTIFLGTAQWNVTLRWNHAINHWTLDFADASNVPVLAGRPVVAGIDLLAQYQHLGFNGSLIAQTSNDPMMPPDFTNLGVTSHLLFLYEQE